MSDEVNDKKSTRLRIVDLCAGLGGFHQGVHRLFAENDSIRTQFGDEWDGYECVLASELNSDLREIYVNNHRDRLNYTHYYNHYPEDGDAEDIDKSITDLFEGGEIAKRIHGDMTTLVDEQADNGSKEKLTIRLDDIEELLNLKEYKDAYVERLQKGTVRKWNDNDDAEYVIPEFDMLCAGFPCQPFSQSGKQQGFDDDRGNVWNMIRIILQSHRPKYVFLENVPNFKSHDKGNTWKRVNDELLILGYNVHAAVLSPQDVGELQTRKRFFIVGELVDEQIVSPFDNKFPPMESKYTALDIIKRYADSGHQSNSKIPGKALKAIEHWQILLSMVHAYNQWCPGEEEKIELPGFPMWGYELDPEHFYPPSDLVSKTKATRERDAKAQRRYITQLNTGRFDQLSKYVDLLHGKSLQDLNEPEVPTRPTHDISDKETYLKQMIINLQEHQQYVLNYTEYILVYQQWLTDVEHFYGIAIGHWSTDKWQTWLDGDERPTYTKNDKGWNPKSKSDYDKKMFIERVRRWAVQELFGKIATRTFDDFIRQSEQSQSGDYDFLFEGDKQSSLFRFSFVVIDAYCEALYPKIQKHHRWLRWWLDTLKKFPHSYQKLELTIGESERKKHVRLHGKYLLQTRPSGIRVKDPIAIPTLVAQGDSQVPIYSQYNPEDQSQDLSDVFKKITVSAQLAFQGFPDQEHFDLPSSTSAASKALGNAVNVKLITAILKLWLLPQKSLDSETS